MEFDCEERAYLFEHFRTQYHTAKRSSRPGAAEVADTWAKLQRLFVTATREEA